MPVFLPIIEALGLNKLWFGILFITNSETSGLTPPFGMALFYMKSVAPPEVSIRDIIRACLPFIPIQLLGVLLVLFFPQTALWLPNLMLG